MPFKRGRQKSFIKRLPVTFEESKGSACALGRCDSPLPFWIRVQPASIFLLLAQEKVRATESAGSEPRVARDGIQQPIIENPIALRLHVPIIIIPLHIPKIALDEPSDAGVELDANVRSLQCAAIPVEGAQILMQL